jgi:hypothetical protein
MELLLCWLFLVAISGYNIQRQHILCVWVSGDEWDTVGMCESFMTRIFCVCRCPTLRGGLWVLGEDWCSLGMLWDCIVKSLDSASKFVIQGVPTGSKVEEGSGGKLILLIPHTMQTQWRDNWLSSETKIGTQYTCKWSLTIQTKFSFTVISNFDGTSVVPNTNLTTVLLNTTKRTQSQQDMLKMCTKGQHCALKESKEYFKE